MEISRLKKRVAGLLAVAVLVAARTASAEPYVAAHVGGVFPINNNLHLIDNRVPLDVTLRNIEFRDNVIVGGKVGYFVDALRVWGIEFDVSRFRLIRKEQTVAAQGFIGSVQPTTATSGKADLHSLVLGLNFVGRIPLWDSKEYRNGRVQPYIGAGPAFFLTRFRVRSEPSRAGVNLSGSHTDDKIGLQALGGIRYLITPQVGFFVEYKFAHANLDFRFADTLEEKFTHNVNQVSAGLSVHF